MRLAILIASRNRPDLVESQVDQIQRTVRIPHDIVVVECGSDPEYYCKHSTVVYDDPDFKGKCYGHNKALEHALEHGKHDYYWVLMNDVVFDYAVDTAEVLIKTLEQNARMACLSPFDIEGSYPGSRRRSAKGWRAVTTFDYLCFMMKGDALREVGFLNPEFQYCWGAIHELAYKLYSKGWFLAYSDEVGFQHLGGSTYGQKNTKTISREEYQYRARRAAFDYFWNHYGPDWDEKFWDTARGHHIEINTFRIHKRYWAQGFSEEELTQRINRSTVPQAIRSGVHNDALSGIDLSAEVKLHLGSGSDRREGWINVDANADLSPDVIARAEHLPMFKESSVDCIEACHLFEHFTLSEAQNALNEWRRILKPDGTLYLELPNFDACVGLIGAATDDNGYDLGMGGIFGYQPLVEKEGVGQVHKWGWNPQTLSSALKNAGFVDVEQQEITQTWRPAAKYNRDMRLAARKPASVVSVSEKSSS